MLNCFNRDPSESPDDVVEIVIDPSTVSGHKKVTMRGKDTGPHLERRRLTQGFELSKEE